MKTEKKLTRYIVLLSIAASLPITYPALLWVLINFDKYMRTLAEIIYSFLRFTR